MLEVRLYLDSDWAGLWRMLEPVFRAGETYPYSPDISASNARAIWVSIPTATFVATDQNGEVVGSYFLKPNQPSLGAHVCNCGYVVAEHARGQGIASLLCEHSLREAVAQGFRAMQYNLVVSTNESAIRVWKKHGFAVVGTLPSAFRHARLGYVDALVMHRLLG